MLEASTEHIYLGSKLLLVKPFSTAVFLSANGLQAGWFSEILDSFQCTFVYPCHPYALCDDDFVTFDVEDDSERGSSMVTGQEIPE